MILKNKLYTYRTIKVVDERPNWNPHPDTRIKNLFFDLCKELNLNGKWTEDPSKMKIVLNHYRVYPSLDGYCEHTVTIILLFDDNVCDDLREIIEEDRSKEEKKEDCKVKAK